MAPLPSPKHSYLAPITNTNSSRHTRARRIARHAHTTSTPTRGNKQEKRRYLHFVAYQHVAQQHGVALPFSVFQKFSGIIMQALTHEQNTHAHKHTHMQAHSSHLRMHKYK